MVAVSSRVPSQVSVVFSSTLATDEGVLYYINFFHIVYILSYYNNIIVAIFQLRRKLL